MYGIEIEKFLTFFTFSEEVYKKMSLTVGDICTAAYSNLPEDNMVT